MHDAGLLVAAGGFLGAIARFAASTFIKSRFPSRFPWGTFAVNLTGAFLLGLFFGLPLGTSAMLFAGTGFMGAYTTFSTLKLEKLQLGYNKDWTVLALYTVATYAAGIGCAWGGYALGVHLG